MSITFKHGDTTDYQAYTGGTNYLSSKSKVYFYAECPLNQLGIGGSTNVYSMKVYTPSGTLYTGYSRNILSFTGNTKTICTGDYEWKRDNGTGTISTTTDYPNANSIATTIFNFITTVSGSNITPTSFGITIRQYIKDRHKNFRFIALVKGAANVKYNVYISTLGADVDYTFTATGSWQTIDIPITNAPKDEKPYGFGISISSSTASTISMIKPMLAIDDAFSNDYTWCPNGCDNYRHYPQNTTWSNDSKYNTETRTAYLDGIDNTFVPIVDEADGISSTNGYSLTVLYEYYTGTNATKSSYETTVEGIWVSTYGAPRITKGSSKIYRSNSSGVADDSGNYFTYETNIFAFPINTLSPKATTFRVRYKQYEADSWTYTAGTAVIQSTSAQTIKITTSQEIDETVSYEAILEYQDSLMLSDGVDYTGLQMLPIPPSYALIDYHSSGKGISFGRVATDAIVAKQGMDLNMPMYLSPNALNGRIEFLSGDASAASSWTAVDALKGDLDSNGNQQTGDTIGTMLNKITTMMKNVRYLGATTGWKALSLNSACVAYSTATTPHYRRRCDLVTLIGDVKPSAAVDAGGEITIGTLPSGCRPPQRISIVCQGSGRATWLCTIETGGTITASRYRTEAGNQAMTTSTWLPFCVTFMV